MRALLTLALLALALGATAQLLPDPSGGVQPRTYDPAAARVVCFTVLPDAPFTVGRIEVPDLSGALQGIVAVGVPKVYVSIDGKMSGVFYRTAVPNSAGGWSIDLAPAIVDGSPRKAVAWILGPNGAKLYLDNATPAAPFAFTVKTVSRAP